MKHLRNQRGFAGIIELAVAVGVLAVLGFVIYRAVSTKPVPTGDSKPAETKVVDPTEGWNTYTSASGKYEFKYPAEWNAKQCDPAEPEPTVYLGPTKASSVICGSEHGGQFFVSSSANTPTESEQHLDSKYFSDITIKDVTIDEVSCTRQTGKVAGVEDSPFHLPADTLYVQYICIKTKRSYFVGYLHAPSGDYSVDYEKEFELIVTKTLKFT